MELSTSLVVWENSATSPSVSFTVSGLYIYRSCQNSPNNLPEINSNTFEKENKKGAWLTDRHVKHVTVWEADLWPGCTWWPRRAPPYSRPSLWLCKRLEFRSDAGWARLSPSGSGRWPEPRRQGRPGTWCCWCHPFRKERGLSAGLNQMEKKNRRDNSFRPTCSWWTMKVMSSPGATANIWPLMVTRSPWGGRRGQLCCLALCCLSSPPSHMSETIFL